MNEIVLVTGCSSGIGLELVPMLLQKGFVVVATALPNSLKDLKANAFATHPNIRCYSLDVSEVEALPAFIQKVQQEVGNINVLINNAGISYRGVVEDMTLSDELHQQKVNFLGPMELIRAVLPSMRKNRKGKIINVSSVSGMMAMPTMASYSASKFALEGASESLWYEVKPFGISVTLVQPGFINSLAFKKVFSPSNKIKEYRSHYKYMTRFVESIMTKTPTTSKSVAKEILKVACSSKPRLRVTGSWDALLFYLLRRFLPRSLYHPILYQSLPGISKWGKVL